MNYSYQSIEKNLIKLRNIHKAFGNNKILKGIDLDINIGEIVVILGPSGSGKTTLLRTINFLDKADEGTITIDGISVDCKHPLRSDILDLRRKTSMVFQNYNLFQNKTIIQNVMEGLITVKHIPKQIAREQAEKLLDKVGLVEKYDSYPSQLSGGQQQRVGIARALIMNPEVILFDEPTSALDPELVGEVLSTIRQVAKTGVTMIIVTHEIAFAREIATRVIFMEGGHIVEQGPPSEVLVNPKEERTKQFLSRITNPSGTEELAK